MTDERGTGQRLAEWMAAGLITSDQADAITSYEAATQPGVTPDTDSPQSTDSRGALAIEVLGYLGGALAFAAVAFLVGQMWDSLGQLGQLLVVGGATVSLLAAGGFLRLAQQAPLRRLARFLWFLSVGGVSATTALVLLNTVYPATDFAEEAVLIVSAASLAAALPLWWFERRALQQAAVFIALAYTVGMGLVVLTDFDASVYAWIAWGIGLAWLVLSYLDRMPPQKTGYALGSIAVLLSPQLGMLESFDAPVLMLGLGVATALGLLAAALFTEERLFLGFGAVGILIYVPQITFEVFGEDTLAVPIVLLVTGLSLIAVAVIYARMRRSAQAS